MGSGVQIGFERRAETRMLCSELVHVRWEDPRGIECRATAILEDIAPSGACLQLEVPVSEGIHLSIAAPGILLRGSVCYCVLRDAGYFTGVRFDDGYKWSERQYRPQHLLDPRTLGTTSS